MNVKRANQLLSHISSRRYFVRKRDIIDLSSLPFTSLATLTEPSIPSSNQNCCGREEKHVQLPPTKIKTLPKTKESIISIQNEPIIDVPKQTQIPEVVSYEKVPLCHEVLGNAWPLSTERVENLMISNKRCYFSNEAVSIKPTTAGLFICCLIEIDVRLFLVPGIGKKYGQILADHGFIYARQLLGYYMMLKDSEMFRKWLEYKFHIPKFRAAESNQNLCNIFR
jgi:hypothetical protein